MGHVNLIVLTKDLLYILLIACKRCIWVYLIGMFCLYYLECLIRIYEVGNNYVEYKLGWA